MLTVLGQEEREVSTLEQLTFGLVVQTQLLLQELEWGQEQEPPWQEQGLPQVPEVQHQLELQSWEDSQAPCSTWVHS